MRFLKAQAKGLVVGLGVLVVWASLDWLAHQAGLPFGQHRSYWATLWAATAGAATVFLVSDA